MSARAPPCCFWVHRNWITNHRQRGKHTILILRGHRILLDEALAELYGVQTKVLVQAVKRNLGRFPEDFMFQLTTPEWAGLR